MLAAAAPVFDRRQEESALGERNGVRSAPDSAGDQR